MKIHLQSKYINHKGKCGRDIIDYPNLILSKIPSEVTCKQCLKYGDLK